METIFINERTDNFYIARWLFLKRKITQAEMIEYSKKSREELIRILHDHNFKVKISGEKKVKFEPSDSVLFDDKDFDDDDDLI